MPLKDSTPSFSRPRTAPWVTDTTRSIMGTMPPTVSTSLLAIRRTPVVLRLAGGARASAWVGTPSPCCRRVPSMPELRDHQPQNEGEDHAARDPDAGVGEEVVDFAVLRVVSR